jgi:DNA-binding XRE family transcriptional regulator
VCFSNVSKYAYFKINLFIEFYLVDNQDKKSILISFGRNLRQLRLAKGFTQEQLANELGIEISQISRIERGVINTSVTTLYAIAKTLKIDVSQLFLFDSP